jgi:vacuolar protein sorting-associated protein 13D
MLLQVDNQMLGGYNSIIVFPTPSEVNYPVVSCFIERLPHESPLAVVFRTVEVKVKHFTVLLEEKLLFKLLQWSGIGTKERESSQHLLLPTRSQWVATVPNDAIPSHQLYIEQLHIHTTELLVNMHTSSQLPSDLMAIKKRLGFPLIQFESPIHFEGFHKFHMLGTPVLYMDAITKHYKKVIQGQAVRILGSVDFLGNPTGLLSDVASGVQGMLTTQPDVVGLVCNVAHGMSDTTSKLTGTVSHVLGHATGDSTFLEEREQNLESCQTSGDHFKAGLINLTSGIFGGVTSILTQPYKGAVEDGMGGFIWGIGKGVVGTIVKPVTGVLDFASGTTAALRETMSQVSRQIPSPMRTRRCCIDATGAISCYSVQLARGQDYLLQLNDGDISEKLISYEKFPTSSGEIRVIISSKCLYFFKDSPPDVTSLTAHVRLDLLVECSLNEAKSTIPSSFIVLTLRDDSNDHRNHSKRSFKCTNESTARKIVQLINYAKNLFNEEKMIIRTLRLQNITIW